MNENNHTNPNVYQSAGIRESRLERPLEYFCSNPAGYRVGAKRFDNKRVMAILHRFAVLGSVAQAVEQRTFNA